MKKVIGLVVVLIVAGVVAFVMYQKQQHQELVEKILRKSNLVIGVVELPESLNPVLAQSKTTSMLADTLFDGLTNLSGRKIDDYQLRLANDLIQDAVKLTNYEVELNTDVAWHDDPKHKFTSDDVLFTYECIINPANDSPLRGRISKLIKQVKVIDKATLEIQFREAISPSRVGWLLPFKIIPATYFGKPMGKDLKTDPVAQEFNRQPIGTGPFKFESWQGNKIVLTSTLVPDLDLENATEETLRKEDAIRSLTVTLINDEEKKIKMMIDGNIDLIMDSDPDLHDKLNQAGLQHADYIPHYFYALAFNTQNAPFNSSRVRVGISRSINKAAVAAVVWKDSPEKYVNKGPFPHNGVRQYQGFRELNRYNVKLARKMMEKAKGKEATMIYSEAGGKAMERIAGKLVQDMAASGLTVNAKALGMAFDTQVKNGNFDMALVLHTGFTKGYDITPLFHSKSAQNISKISNKKLDALLLKWQNTAFWTEKLPLSKKIHEVLSKQSPYIFLFTLPTRAYYAPRFKEVVIIDPSALLASVESWTISDN